MREDKKLSQSTYDSSLEFKSKIKVKIKLLNEYGSV